MCVLTDVSGHIVPSVEASGGVRGGLVLGGHGGWGAAERQGGGHEPATFHAAC